MIVQIVSSKAKIPLKVRFNFSPFEFNSPVLSSTNLSPAVNLWIAAIISNILFAIFSTVASGNISTQASLIDLIMPVIIFPMFLNELRNSHLPLISSTLTIRSLIDKPNLSDTFSNSLKAFILSSEYPLAFNSVSDNFTSCSTNLASSSVNFSVVLSCLF